MFNHSLTSAYFTYSSCFVYFVCFACFVLDMAFISVAYVGEKEFKEYLSQAKALKEDISKSTAGFAPEKIFDGYNSNPEPAKYYSEDSASASQTLKSDSISNLTTNKEGQAIAESSKTRPQFKINQESEEIKGSKKIQTLASKSIKGTIEGFLTGEEEQVDTKSTKYVIKTCNEEIRPLKRVCNKLPVVQAELKSNLYPNCMQVLVETITTLWGNSTCPGGYSIAAHLYTETGMKMRLCVKPVTLNESLECYVSYYTHEPPLGTYISPPFDKGKILVPKNRHARLKLSSYYPRDVSGNNECIIVSNLTTGTAVYNSTPICGQTIDLPFSASLDQTFYFYLSASRYRPLGVITAHIEHEYKEPSYSIKWQESCYDI